MFFKRVFSAGKARARRQQQQREGPSPRSRSPEKPPAEPTLSPSHFSANSPLPLGMCNSTDLMAYDPVLHLMALPLNTGNMRIVSSELEYILENTAVAVRFDTVAFIAGKGLIITTGVSATGRHLIQFWNLAAADTVAASEFSPSTLTVRFRTTVLEKSTGTPALGPVTPVMSPAASPRLFYLGTDEGDVRIVDAMRRELTSYCIAREMVGKELTSVFGNGWAEAFADPVKPLPVRLPETATSRPTATVGFVVTGIAENPVEPSRLLIGYAGGIVVEWSLDKCKVSRIFSSVGSGRPGLPNFSVHSLTWHPDGRLFAVAGMGGGGAIPREPLVLVFNSHGKIACPAATVSLPGVTGATLRAAIVPFIYWDAPATTAPPPPPPIIKTQSPSTPGGRPQRPPPTAAGSLQVPAQAPPSAVVIGGSIAASRGHPQASSAPLPQGVTVPAQPHAASSSGEGLSSSAVLIGHLYVMTRPAPSEGFVRKGTKMEELVPEPDAAEKTKDKPPAAGDEQSPQSKNVFEALAQEQQLDDKTTNAEAADAGASVEAEVDVAASPQGTSYSLPTISVRSSTDLRVNSGDEYNLWKLKGHLWTQATAIFAPASCPDGLDAVTLIPPPQIRLPPGAYRVTNGLVGPGLPLDVEAAGGRIGDEVHRLITPVEGGLSAIALTAAPYHRLIGAVLVAGSVSSSSSPRGSSASLQEGQWTAVEACESAEPRRLTHPIEFTPEWQSLQMGGVSSIKYVPRGGAAGGEGDAGTTESNSVDHSVNAMFTTRTRRMLGQLRRSIDPLAMATAGSDSGERDRMELRQEDMIPIASSTWGRSTEEFYSGVLVTGHKDGSVKLWAVFHAHLVLLHVISCISSPLDHPSRRSSRVFGEVGSDSGGERCVLDEADSRPVVRLMPMEPSVSAVEVWVDAKELERRDYVVMGCESGEVCVWRWQMTAAPLAPSECLEMQVQQMVETEPGHEQEVHEQLTSAQIPSPSQSPCPSQPIGPRQAMFMRQDTRDQKQGSPTHSPTHTHGRQPTGPSAPLLSYGFQCCLRVMHHHNPITVVAIVPLSMLETQKLVLVSADAMGQLCVTDLTTGDCLLNKLVPEGETNEGAARELAKAFSVGSLGWTSIDAFTPLKATHPLSFSQTDPADSPEEPPTDLQATTQWTKGYGLIGLSNGELVQLDFAANTVLTGAVYRTTLPEGGHIILLEELGGDERESEGDEGGRRSSEESSSGAAMPINVVVAVRAHWAGIVHCDNGQPARVTGVAFQREAIHACTATFEGCPCLVIIFRGGHVHVFLIRVSEEDPSPSLSPLPTLTLHLASSLSALQQLLTPTDRSSKLHRFNLASFVPTPSSHALIATRLSDEETWRGGDPSGVFWTSIARSSRDKDARWRADNWRTLSRLCQSVAMGERWQRGSGSEDDGGGGVRPTSFWQSINRNLFGGPRSGSLSDWIDDGASRRETNGDLIDAQRGWKPAQEDFSPGPGDPQYNRASVPKPRPPPPPTTAVRMSDPDVAASAWMDQVRATKAPPPSTRAAGNDTNAERQRVREGAAGVQQSLGQAKDTVGKNIERLQGVSLKTDQLAADAQEFYSMAKQLANRYK
ncbi:unnamed protein product [Vitrella brassicaformis CCMP3155]|uniref:V-SNARE coiled-coil homology domain-containing protein n=1 Tax=Vitrella brassicaformis (strain CCMP3155) TaxID=1169540 RepID=A0A0G4GBP3_VITBC|nr:unnamed protein product [Vitrella brassicaformis CCMP3155]|eukprot:CEM26515.1 unnamed protein product [Vitrella brassicaformis CCMP3155]